MKLSEIVKWIDDAIVIKDGEFDFFKLITQQEPYNCLTFIEDERYLINIDESIKCIICNDRIANKISDEIGVIISKRPKIDFFSIYNELTYKKNMEIKKKTLVGKNCFISDKCIIDDYNVIIGDNVIIEENVIIRSNVEIGNNSIIRAGTIIGGEGFQFVKNGKESILPIVHAGKVKIGENVELQYGVRVDKAVFEYDSTVIDNYTKIDNNVHVGHAAKLGKRCLAAANALVSGSTIIGDDCWIGAGAIISNSIVIGNGCRVNIGSVVTKDLESGKSVSGNFAIDHTKFLNFIKTIR